MAQALLLVDVGYGVLWCRLLLDHTPLDEAAGRPLASLSLRSKAKAIEEKTELLALTPRRGS